MQINSGEYVQISRGEYVQICGENMMQRSKGKYVKY